MTDVTMESFDRSIADCKYAISEQNEQMVDHQAGLIVYLKRNLERSRDTSKRDQAEIKKLTSLLAHSLKGNKVAEDQTVKKLILNNFVVDADLLDAQALAVSHATEHYRQVAKEGFPEMPNATSIQEELEGVWNMLHSMIDLVEETK